MYEPNRICQLPDIFTLAAQLPKDEIVGIDPMNRCRDRYCGYVCTRSKNHDGPHIGGFGNGAYFKDGVWANAVE